jgi:alcohol dehydrogenase class IV
MRTWSFHTVGQLTFGPGSVAELGELLGRRGLRQPLIVTDTNLANNGVLDRVRSPLVAVGLKVEVFDGGQAEPTLEAAQQAIECARAVRPDAILGLGGGSNLDLAKMTAAVLTHGGGPRDYLGVDKVPGPILPLIAVPTTAGSGSEVSHAMVLTDAAAKIKVAAVSNHVRPALAVVDPELSYSCPPRLTADSGIDALTHAIEAYTATDYRVLDLPPAERAAYTGRFPLTDGLAEQAITLVGNYLVRAVSDGGDREARDGMAQAATLAGMAFSNAGVALVHALEYPLGGALHCSHGAGNGLLLPHVMRFNLPACPTALARIATLLGESTAGLSDEQAAQLAITAVERLRRQIGIPERLRDWGAAEDQLATFAEQAFALQRLRRINPRPSTREDLVAILRAAF